MSQFPARSVDRQPWCPRIFMLSDKEIADGYRALVAKDNYSQREPGISKQAAMDVITIKYDTVRVVDKFIAELINLPK